MSAGQGSRAELVAVSKHYPAGEVSALRDVSLTVEAGSFLSIEGPSGCGKTTLLNLLGLLDVPTSGVVRWDGRDAGSLRERERARLRLHGVGFIFQRFHLLPTLTAFQNVELPLRAAGRRRPERERRVHELLGSVGLAGRASAFPHQLSGGEEQRVAVARALANGPGLLLADEPTGELDQANAESVLDLLAEAQRESGASLVVVTHNAEVARRARRHLRMLDGKIVADSLAE
ncbi:MAG TPA: ABC transporter ATP-binding protein [Thermoplasmata archaeon]|nr:ABC transporter ATP-binding protein [Thermoplasmata archaeon]